LSALAKRALGEEPASGNLYVFLDRRRSYMEVLDFDRGG